MIFDRTNQVIGQVQTTGTLAQRTLLRATRVLALFQGLVAMIDPILITLQTTLLAVAATLRALAQLLRAFPIRNAIGNIVRGSARAVQALAVRVQLLARKVRRYRPRLQRRLARIERKIFNAQMALAKATALLNMLLQILSALKWLSALLKPNQPPIEKENPKLYATINDQYLTPVENALRPLNALLADIDKAGSEAEAQYREFRTQVSVANAVAALAQSLNTTVAPQVAQITAQVNSLQAAMGPVASRVTSFLMSIPLVNRVVPWVAGKAMALANALSNAINTVLQGPFNSLMAPLEALFAQLELALVGVISRANTEAQKLQDKATLLLTELKVFAQKFNAVTATFRKLHPKKLIGERDLIGLLDDLIEALQEFLAGFQQGINTADNQLSDTSDRVQRQIPDDQPPYFARQPLLALSALSQRALQMSAETSERDTRIVDAKILLNELLVLRTEANSFIKGLPEVEPAYFDALSAADDQARLALQESQDIWQFALGDAETINWVEFDRTMAALTMPTA